MNDERTFSASEVLMLMLDCGTSAVQLFHQVPGFRMQSEFILTSKDENSAKRLAFHSLLLNVASQIITDYIKAKDEQSAEKAEEPVDSKEQEDTDDGTTVI